MLSSGVERWTGEKAVFTLTAGFHASPRLRASEEMDNAAGDTPGFAVGASAAAGTNEYKTSPSLYPLARAVEHEDEDDCRVFAPWEEMDGCRGKIASCVLRRRNALISAAGKVGGSIVSASLSRLARRTKGDGGDLAKFGEDVEDNAEDDAEQAEEEEEDASGP